MAIKDDYIKVRVTTEQKKLFKDIAKKKKVSRNIIMSTFRFKTIPAFGGCRRVMDLKAEILIILQESFPECV